jgi:hypothetical protein
MTARPMTAMSALGWFICSPDSSSIRRLTLNAGGTALGEGFHLFDVAMVVSPGKVVSRAPWAQPRRTASSGVLPAEQAVDEAGGVTVAAAHAVHHVQFAGRGLVGLARRSRPPRSRCGGWSSAPRAGWWRPPSRSGTSSLPFQSPHRTPRGRAWSWLHVLTLDAEALLQVLLVADQTSTFSTMRASTSTALAWPPQMSQSFWR